ncbi:hypothetical protein NDU88_006711 [Pleurodeles waltl]|uniref:Uncharacterized protein n=1 Tax=Pleurodeles waltl TaxID=8319 RepID=A0AAV7PLQ7_PLEWA|nr:hypothetical protein NDU88_006711 [Pleurodeles waltl]
MQRVLHGEGRRSQENYEAACERSKEAQGGACHELEKPRGEAKRLIACRMQRAGEPRGLENRMQSVVEARRLRELRAECRKGPEA